ncbi:LysR family transcriptional regulator [Burkholderia aenigmatica]|uniref:LysR family transcriptional regulator n=1 Tax=Burkholderia aenigmatica TaxID=2015348 RepID=UPI0026503A0A|nr:LysR family transcriptional regulator [Burkholderia aenigmatica]MDN7876040.1 LysR family transcriptional regulator [Burkholderia aenigmatica]
MNPETEMDKLQSMRSFVQVVNDGSFIRAATRLGISQMMISRRVNWLEEQLERRLLVRRTRSVSLTDFGKTYYTRVSDILAKLDEVEHAVSVPTQTPSGTLRVAVSVGLSLRHLSSCLRDYCDSYPEVVPVPVLVDRPVDLVADGYDAGIFDLSSLSCTSLVARAVFSSPLIACASPDYLQRRGEPTRPEELAEHAYLAISSPQRGKSELQLDSADGTVTITCHPAVVANNIDFLMQMVLSGAGIALIHPALVQLELEKGTLKRVLPDYWAPSPTFGIVYPSRRHLPAKVRTFIDHLLATFDESETAWHSAASAQCQASASAA